MGYVIIPKPHFSSSEGINSRCRHFDLLLFGGLAQSVAAIIAVVATHVVAGDRLIVTGVTTPFRRVARCFIQQTLVRDSILAIVFGCFFASKKIHGNNNM